MVIVVVVARGELDGRQADAPRQDRIGRDHVGRHRILGRDRIGLPAKHPSEHVERVLHEGLP
jgi:hypothetical protein